MRAALALGAIFLLAGCGSTDSSEPGRTDLDPDSRGSDTTLTEHPITLKDGRKVTCVVLSGYRQGGVSCDWPMAAR